MTKKIILPVDRDAKLVIVKNGNTYTFRQKIGRNDYAKPIVLSDMDIPKRGYEIQMFFENYLFDEDPTSLYGVCQYSGAARKAVLYFRGLDN